jgi:hypothetical protein
MGIEYYFLRDSNYYCTDLEGYKKLLPHLLQDGYRTTFKDCEDMAFQAMLDSSTKYDINAVGVVIGSIPGGYHAFCILYIHDLDKFMLFEPNRNGYGDGPFEIGERNYQVGKVLI